LGISSILYVLVPAELRHSNSTSSRWMEKIL
jgi:hypothetical protein